MLPYERLQVEALLELSLALTLSLTVSLTLTWMGSGCEASLTVVRPDEAESALASAATPPSSSALPEISSISSVTPSIAKTRASAIRPSSAILFAERSSSLSRMGAPLSSAHLVRVRARDRVRVGVRVRVS